MLLSSSDSALAGRIRPSSAHPRGRNRGNEQTSPAPKFQDGDPAPWSPYVSTYLQEYGSTSKQQPFVRQLGRLQPHKSANETAVNFKVRIDLPAKAGTADQHITQSKDHRSKWAEDSARAEKGHALDAELNQALDAELKRLLIGKGGPDGRATSPNGFLPLCRRRSATLQDRNSPGDLALEQAVFQDTEKSAIETMVRKQRVALEAAEQSLEDALCAKYKHPRSNVGAPRPGAVASQRPSVAGILGSNRPGSQKALPTVDLLRWHQAQEQEAAQERALRDLEVRLKTEMWEAEAARMAALERLQGDQDSGQKRFVAFLNRDREAAYVALEQCRQELQAERQKCAQAEREVDAQNVVQERMTWLLQSFVKELGSVSRLLATEMREQRMQAQLEASPQAPQENRELWVLGEVKARQLQKDNQRLLAELKQAMTNVQPLIDKETQRLTQQIREYENTIDELEVRVNGYKQELRSLTKNNKVTSADDRIKMEMEDFENCIANATAVENMVRDHNKDASVAGRLATFGRYLHFDLGLTRFYGKPPIGDDDVLVRKMQMECDKDYAIETSNYGGIKTDLRTEWQFVADPEHPSLQQRMQENHYLVGGMPRPSGDCFPRRELRPLSAFLQHPLREEAGLTKAEVIGLRLYTGPAYCVINSSLRAVLAAEAHANEEADPALRKQTITDAYLEKVDQGEFTAVASAINSGLKKLARVTPLAPGRRLYRGLSNLFFESRLLAEGGTPAERSFVEVGFSSATPNLEVALQYASGEFATLLEIDTGAIDRGAHLKWISQFPVEDEHTILPLSSFEVVKTRTVSRKALQQEVSLQRNQRIFASLLRLRECPQLKATFRTLQLLDNIFEEIDNDSNGLVTKDEFRKYVKRSHESTALAQSDDVVATQQLKSLLPDKFEDMCNKMDSGDKDGKISRSEFFEYYMDFLLETPSSQDSDTQTVFALIRQMSRANSSQSQRDETRSAFDMSIEQFSCLLQSLKVALTQSEMRNLFAFVDNDQDGMLDLTELSRAVAGRGADSGKKIDGLKRDMKEARLQQISEESGLYVRRENYFLGSKSDDYITVFSVKLNSNLKAQDAMERTLKLEAHNVRYCGKEIIQQLDETFRNTAQKMNGNPYLPYAEWNAIDYLQIHNFRRAIDDLLAVWTKVLRDEKVRAENQISAADTIMEELLERMAEEPSSDAADGKKVDTLLEGACKLMALCEAANDEDVKRFWPLVEESFKKLGLYFQYIEGADGLITLMQIMREKSLVDNSVLNARRAMDKLVADVCNEYNCIPLLFSNGDAIQEVATLLGPDSQQLKRVQALRSVSAKEMDLQGVATYLQKFTRPVKTHERGITVFRNVQGTKFEDALRAKFGEAGVVKSIFVSLKTLPSSSQAVAEACSLLEALVDSRPTDADSGGERDAVLAQLDLEMPALLDLLEVHQANEKHVAEFLWILNQICETHGQKGRAIDRLLEYGANTKIHACEKRFAGHALVKHNSELLMAKIKQRQAQG